MVPRVVIDLSTANGGNTMAHGMQKDRMYQLGCYLVSTQVEDPTT